MISEEEWRKLILRIHCLIDIEGLFNIEMTIPQNLFFEAIDESERYFLSVNYIRMKVSSVCRGKEISKTIKIKFGPNKNIDVNKNEIIIGFKYARLLVPKLIEYFQPITLKINTANLIEQKDIFSEPISTLEGKQ